MTDEPRAITDDMGALLWRRYYEARVELANTTHLLPETLKALLEQAGIPEPEDDLVFGPGGVRHGRTMARVYGPLERPTARQRG